MKNLHKIERILPFEWNDRLKANLWAILQDENAVRITTRKIVRERYAEDYSPIQYHATDWYQWMWEDWRMEEWIMAGSPEPDMSRVIIGDFPLGRM